MIKLAIFTVFGASFLRNARSSIAGASEPICGVHGDGNPGDSDRGTRWRWDTFVRETQAAPRAAITVQQTIFSIGGALSIALSVTVTEQE